MPVTFTIVRTTKLGGVKTLNAGGLGGTSGRTTGRWASPRVQTPSTVNPLSRSVRGLTKTRMTAFFARNSYPSKWGSSTVQKPSTTRGSVVGPLKGLLYSPSIQKAGASTPVIVRSGGFYAYRPSATRVIKQPLAAGLKMVRPSPVGGGLAALMAGAFSSSKIPYPVGSILPQPLPTAKVFVRVQFADAVIQSTTPTPSNLSYSFWS